MMVVYQETFVQRNQHRIYVREYLGEEPAIILMHGFPDNYTSTTEPLSRTSATISRRAAKVRATIARILLNVLIARGPDPVVM
jgi:hypothetical protein